MIQARRRFLSAMGAAAAVAATPRALAAGYPERAITFICPWPVGGTADLTMRALCTAASKQLGQSIVFENKAGASGMLGLKALASARPDGYTIGQIPVSVARFAQLGTVQLNPMRDLTYIARTSGQTFGIAVKADSPFKTLKEFVAAARAQPGKLSYGHAGIGGATHVGMEEFALAAGVTLNAVAYKGGAPALADLMGGQIDAVADSSSWAPHVKSGKLRLLATWGEKRTQDFPDVPTLRDQGFDVVVDAPNGVGAPRGLDASVERRLREAFRAAVASSEFTSVCDRIDVPVMYLDGPDYEQYVAAVVQREKTLIERLKLHELVAKG